MFRFRKRWTSQNHDPAAPLQSEVAPGPPAATGGNKDPNEGTSTLEISQKAVRETELPAPASRGQQGVANLRSSGVLMLTLLSV